MASTDHGQSFGFDGKPSASSSVNNKFDLALQLDGNETWTEQSEGDSASEIPSVGSPGNTNKTDMSLTLEPNKFPRQHGSDSLPDDPVPLS